LERKKKISPPEIQGVGVRIKMTGGGVFEGPFKCEVKEESDT